MSLLMLLLGLGATLSVQAHPVDRAGTAEATPAMLRQVGMDQRIGEVIPLDLPFWDETARPVHLRDYFDSKPVILALTYTYCLS
jgi:cytochrome oxidase Cu insertion factor (SCO1/SenC/PrrC family)